jgi:hypothetical protein
LYTWRAEFRQEPGRPQWLWIDQMGIDQTNVKERSHLVRFMSRIYSQCTRLCVPSGTCCIGSVSTQRIL